jgi:hypothetical protein
MSLRSIFVCAAFLAAASAAGAEPRQGSVLVSFADGHVTVVATDARAADVLAEWSRVGRTEIIGLDRLSGRRLTLTLKSVDEGAAIEEILGSGYGFAATIKTVPDGTASRFTRLVVGGSTAPPPADSTRRAQEPESIYDYGTPRKAGPPSADSDLAAGLAMTKDLPAGTPPSQPERIFEYYTPIRVIEALSRPQPVVIIPEPGTPPPAFVDPELRFQYYVPGKAAPKPPPAPKKPGDGGTTPR